MDFQQVLGNRRSIRYFDPDRPVEREKVQKILEAMRIASCAMNAHWLRGIVVKRDDLDPAEFAAASGLRGVEARRRRNCVVSFLSHNGVLIEVYHAGRFRSRRALPRTVPRDRDRTLRPRPPRGRDRRHGLRPAGSPQTMAPERQAGESGWLMAGSFARSSYHWK